MRPFVLMLLAFASLALNAQKFIVEEELTADQFDVTAQSKPRMDLAGHACALVKVWCALDGVRFTGNTIGDPLYSDGEYWVYVTQGSKQLTIRHARVLPTTIHFAPLQGGVTYRLTLQLPESLYGLLFNPSASSQPVQPTQPQQAIPTQTALAQQSSSQVEPFTVKGVSFNMVRVDGGTFQMGSGSDDSEAYDWEKPQHSVTLTKDYYIGETEVTQALWKAVMGKNPSNRKGDNLPVEKVSWDDCQEFIKKLNSLTNRNFRLPTEAEWEFAARGGNLSKHYKYSGSDTIGDVAWYDGNSDSKTHPVKQKAANELDLYDMSGNVYEWCADWYGSYSSGSQTDPTGPSSGSYRVSRGGSRIDSARNCRVAYRCGRAPVSRNFYLGLRLALDE